MGSPSETAPDFDDSDRIIDRSGDIDQRPPEERRGREISRVLPFPPHRAEGDAHRDLQHYDPPAPPASRPQTPPAGLPELAQRSQKDLDKQFLKAKSSLEVLSQRIEAQEKRCLPPKLDDDLQQIRFQRQKVLIANGPLLADCLREERSRLADLENFKKENRLRREAHYPVSPLLAFGVLSILVLLEAGINGVLFADSSDQGLFGGWLEALVLSIANVGAAFLFGRMVLPLLHRPGYFLRAGCLVLCLAGIASLAAINLFGAHYRDFRSAQSSLEQPFRPQPVPKHEKLSGLTGARLARKAANAASPLPAISPQAPAAAQARIKESETIRKMFDAPLTFDSFMSVFLFVIGLCGACIAAIDGYKFDDPFPGYGKRHRRYAEARANSTDALRRILNQSNAIMAGSFQAISRKIENFAHEMSALQTLHHAYAGDYKALKDSLEDKARDGEAQLACHVRLANKLPDRDSAELYAIAVKQLPPLSEKQIKFYEAQDKKLKALQKSAQKEQNDVLGVFETASSDFQKLLADASQASLRAVAGDAA